MEPRLNRWTILKTRNSGAVCQADIVKLMHPDSVWRLTYNREYPEADLSPSAAAGYGGCQVLMEAVKRAAPWTGRRSGTPF